MIELHASCVVWGEIGMLITGESGVGKSGLVSHCLMQGAKLVADDRVQLRAEHNTLIATAPDAIRGLIELNQVGIFDVSVLADASATVRFEIELTDHDALERMPQRAYQTYESLTVPKVTLSGKDRFLASKTWLLSQIIPSDPLLDGIEIAKLG